VCGVYRHHRHHLFTPRLTNLLSPETSTYILTIPVTTRLAYPRPIAVLRPNPRPSLSSFKTTGAEVTGRQKTLAMDVALRTRHFPNPKTKTETETRGIQDQDQDSEVPRPRLVKTGLETSRGQDSSLKNSKSGNHLTSQFLSVPSSFNLTQHVDFPTHNKSHVLESRPRDNLF